MVGFIYYGWFGCHPYLVYDVVNLLISRVEAQSSEECRNIFNWKFVGEGGGSFLYLDVAEEILHVGEQLGVLLVWQRGEKVTDRATVVVLLVLQHQGVHCPLGETLLLFIEGEAEVPGWRDKQMINSPGVGQLFTK